MYTEAQRPQWHTLALLLLAIPACWALWNLGSYVIYFAHPQAYVWDSTLYWAMGRAVLNDLRLYIDVFDNKPPAVYLLSAVSLWLFGNGMLGNLLGMASLLMLPILSLWLVIKECRKTLCNLRTLAFMAVLALLLSISWVDFQAANGHPWQTEQFSALFAIAYAFLLVSAKHSWWHTTLLAISLLGAIGFKEPFLISCLAAALLVDARPSALKQNFLVPLGIAAILGMIIMALTGTLLPYLTYDLPMVFGFRLTGFADPLWMRFLGTHKILLRFERAAPLLPIVAVATSIALAWFNWKTSPKPSALLRATGVTILIIVLGTFSVGIGGDFQDHHFAVLTPLAAALIFLVLKNCIKQHKTKRAHLMCILLLLVSSISILLTSPKINWSALQSQKEEEQKLRSVAAGVDTVLDHCNVDRYLYIHPTGKLRLDGFTAHSPINHALFMSIDNAFQNGQTFLDESLLRLSLAKIIVLSTDGFTPNNDIGDVIAKYMLTTFTASPPDCALPLPEIPGFFLAFRTKDQPLDLQINMEY